VNVNEPTAVETAIEVPAV